MQQGKEKKKIDISFKNVRVNIRLPINTRREQVETWVKLADPFGHKKNLSIIFTNYLQRKGSFSRNE